MLSATFLEIRQLATVRGTTSGTQSRKPWSRAARSLGLCAFFGSAVHVIDGSMRWFAHQAAGLLPPPPPLPLSMLAQVVPAIARLQASLERQRGSGTHHDPSAQARACARALLRRLR